MRTIDKKRMSIGLLKLCVIAILLMHGLTGMFEDGLRGFGQYLNGVGFAPLGLALAWGIKGSHLIMAVCIGLKKYLFWPGLITIVIFLLGVFMVHLPNGWFVVGGGFNGVEFNLLLIAAVLVIMQDKNVSS